MNRTETVMNGLALLLLVLFLSVTGTARSQAPDELTATAAQDNLGRCEGPLVRLSLH